MARFVLTAQLQLQAPNNTQQVIQQVRKQLSGVKSVEIPVEVKGAVQAERAIQDVKDATIEATGAAEALGRSFGLAVKRFAAFTVASRAVSLFTNSLAKALEEAIDFQREVVRLSQVTGTSVKGLQGLQDTITNLSTGLGVVSRDLLDVTVILSQAGVRGKDLDVALQGLAKSTLAPTFDDIKETAEGAVAILSQFEEGAGRLEAQLGAINAVSAAFAVESDDLIGAVRRFGGVFKASGGSLEELLAVFTSVRQTTRESAESISTGLRTIFTRIQRPDTIRFLRELGVELTDAEGRFVGPLEATVALGKAFSELPQGDIQFVRIAEELGGFRQIGKVIPLIQQYEVALEALKVAQEGQNSLSQDAVTAQQALSVQITKVKEEFLSFVRAVADSDSFQIFTRTALELASALIKIADAAKPLIPLLGSIAAFRFAQGLGSFFAGAGAAIRNTSQRRNSGGEILQFSRGGFVPGVGNRDTVPAMLQPGEFVIRKSSVQKLGADTLNAINNNRYNVGGAVSKNVAENSTSYSFNNFKNKNLILTPAKYNIGGIANEKDVGIAVPDIVSRPPKNAGVKIGATTVSLRDALTKKTGFGQLSSKSLQDLFVEQGTGALRQGKLNTIGEFETVAKRVVGITQKRFRTIVEGVTSDDYESFDRNVTESAKIGIARGAEGFAASVGASIPPVSFVDNFTISGGFKGELFEQILDAFQGQPLQGATKESNRPFDFTQGLQPRGTLFKELADLNVKYVDAKASANAKNISESEFNKKITGQFALDILNSNFPEEIRKEASRKLEEVESKKGNTPQLKAGKFIVGKPGIGSSILNEQPSLFKSGGVVGSEQQKNKKTVDIKAINPESFGAFTIVDEGDIASRGRKLSKPAADTLRPKVEELLTKARPADIKGKELKRDAAREKRFANLGITPPSVKSNVASRVDDLKGLRGKDYDITLRGPFKARQIGGPKESVKQAFAGEISSASESALRAGVEVIAESDLVRTLDIPPINTDEGKPFDYSRFLEGAKESVEGYLLEGVVGALTNAKIGGGETNFDFPDLSKGPQKGRLKKLFSDDDDFISNLSAADAKRQKSTAESGEGSLINKIAKSDQLKIALANRGGVIPDGVEIETFAIGGPAQKQKKLVQKGVQVAGVGIFDSDKISRVASDTEAKDVLDVILNSKKSYDVISGPSGSGKTTFAQSRFGNNFVLKAEDVAKYSQFVVISGAGKTRSGGFSENTLRILSGAKKIIALNPDQERIEKQRQKRIDLAVAGDTQDKRSIDQLEKTLVAPTDTNLDLLSKFKNVEILDEYALGGLVKFNSGGIALPLIDDIKNTPDAIQPKPDFAIKSISVSGYGAVDVDRTLFRTKGDQAYARAKTPQAQQEVLAKFFRDPVTRLNDVKTSPLTKFGQTLKKNIEEGSIDPSKLFVISKSGMTPGLPEYINEIFNIPISQMRFTDGGSKQGPLEEFRKSKSVEKPPIKRASGGSIGGTDTVPALLTPGEFVVNKKAAQRIGYNNLNTMNKTGVARFASGGVVGVQKFNNGGSPDRSVGKIFNLDNLAKIAIIAPAVTSALSSLGGTAQDTEKEFNTAKASIDAGLDGLTQIGLIAFSYKQAASIISEWANATKKSTEEVLNNANAQSEAADEVRSISKKQSEPVEPVVSTSSTIASGPATAGTKPFLAERTNEEPLPSLIGASSEEAAKFETNRAKQIEKQISIKEEEINIAQQEQSSAKESLDKIEKARQTNVEQAQRITALQAEEESKTAGLQSKFEVAQKRKLKAEENLANAVERRNKLETTGISLSKRVSKEESFQGRLREQISTTRESGDFVKVAQLQTVLKSSEAQVAKFKVRMDELRQPTIEANNNVLKYRQELDISNRSYKNASINLTKNKNAVSSYSSAVDSLSVVQQRNLDETKRLEGVVKSATDREIKATQKLAKARDLAKIAADKSAQSINQLLISEEKLRRERTRASVISTVRGGVATVGRAGAGALAAVAIGSTIAQSINSVLQQQAQFAENRARDRGDIEAAEKAATAGALSQGLADAFSLSGFLQLAFGGDAFRNKLQTNIRNAGTRAAVETGVSNIQIVNRDIAEGGGIFGDTTTSLPARVDKITSKVSSDALKVRSRLEKLDPTSKERIEAERQLNTEVKATITSLISQNISLEQAQQSAISLAGGNKVLEEQFLRLARSSVNLREAQKAQAKANFDSLKITSAFNSANIAVKSFVESLETGSSSLSGYISQIEAARSGIGIDASGAVDVLQKTILSSASGPQAVGLRQAIFGQANVARATLGFAQRAGAAVSGLDLSIANKDVAASNLKSALRTAIPEGTSTVIQDQISKIIEASVDKAAEKGDISQVDISKLIQDINSQGQELSDGFFEAVKLQAEHTATMTGLYKQREEIERKAAEALNSAIDTQLEAAEKFESFGGERLTNNQQLRARIAQFNNVGVAAGVDLRTGGADDIRRVSTEISNLFNSQQNAFVQDIASRAVSRKQDPSIFAGPEGVVNDRREEAKRANEELISFTKKRIALLEDELEIVRAKNKEERSALDKLISGDIEGFIKGQAAAGAGAALRSGSAGLSSLFSASALGAGFKSLEDQDLSDRELKRAAQLTLGGFGITGKENERAAGVLAGITPEEEAIKSEGRELSSALGDLAGQAAKFEVSNIAIQNATITAANVKFQNELSRVSLANTAVDQGAVATNNNLSSGGIVYANRGIFVPRGTDTVPAMLTPGEFVVNRSAVKRGNNLQILQAMNSRGGANRPNHMKGVGRVYYNTGGVVEAAVGNAFSEAIPALRNVFADFSATVDRLVNTQFSVKLDTTNVNVNFNGASFLASMKEDIKRELLDEVAREISKAKPNSGGDMQLRNTVL